MSDTETSGFHSQFGRSFIGNLASQISLHVRKKMYGLFAKEFMNCKNVLDVGVTSENLSPEANFFEEMYPYKNRITAVGVEDAQHLEKRYQGLKFVKVEPGQKLPFKEKEFEVAFSNAVVEHIVDEGQREEFVAEILRVSRSFFITTPNRFFPIEVHTGAPLVHIFSPKFFNYLMDKKIISQFYNSKNLKLLSYSDLVKLAEKFKIPYRIYPIRLFGLVSNWVVIFKQAD